MPYPEYTKEELDEFRKNNPMLTWGMPSWDCIKYMKKEYEEANRKEPAKTEEARIESEKKVEEKASESGILKYVTEVKVSATSRFVAKDHIESANVVVINDNFKNLFLNKIEEDVSDAELVVSELKKASLDVPIMAELEEKKKIFLAHFFQLLERQSEGQPGHLLTNGNVTFGYIPDEEGNFWAVRARWRAYNRGWYVGAGSVDGPGGWCGGGQVLSCKAYLSVSR